jgi:uncharacterized protein (DUF1778 family)
MLSTDGSLSLIAHTVTMPASEETVQIRVSAETKKEIRRIALERDETVRTFILRALQARGVILSESEIGDRRKAGSR